MSHPVIEIAAAVTVALVLAVGVIVLPRHKPEPPQQEQRPPVESVEVQPPPVVQAERVADLERKAERIADEQRALIKQVKFLTEREKGK